MVKLVDIYPMTHRWSKQMPKMKCGTSVVLLFGIVNNNKKTDRSVDERQLTFLICNWIQQEIEKQSQTTTRLMVFVCLGATVATINHIWSNWNLFLYYFIHFNGNFSCCTRSIHLRAWSFAYILYFILILFLLFSPFCCGHCFIYVFYNNLIFIFRLLYKWAWKLAWYVVCHFIFLQKSVGKNVTVVHCPIRSFFHFTGIENTMTCVLYMQERQAFEWNYYIFCCFEEKQQKQQPEHPIWVWMDSRIANCIDKYVHNQFNQTTTVSGYKLSVWRHHIAIFIAIGLVVLKIQQQWNLCMYICTLQLSSHCLHTSTVVNRTFHARNRNIVLINICLHTLHKKIQDKSLFWANWEKRNRHSVVMKECSLAEKKPVRRAMN